MQRTFFFILIITAIFSTSCIQNVEDLSDDIVNIDPEDVSYAADIQTIFNASCGGSGCHINSSVNGVNLSSYSAVMGSVGAVSGESIINAGNPDESVLVQKIEPNPPFGSRMPTTGDYLTPTEIAQIRAWITGGAQDN